MGLLAAETVSLLEEGSVQFILFTVMIVAVFVILWLTIAK